jgi:SAM-dependent methyltransferase
MPGDSARRRRQAPAGRGTILPPDVFPGTPLAISPIGHEALDGPGGDPATVRATLADIARVNALLGGSAAAAFGLRRLLEHAPDGRVLTLLDVGAGSGDIALHLARRAWRRGVRLRPVALERHPVAARLCRRAGVPVALADGGRLPLADGAVDVVLASQLLHHLERASAIVLLQELARVARVGVIVADLRRHAVAAAGIWLASYLLRLHRVTRHDGVTSVRRGFTASELAALLRAAGLAGEVHARPGYRLVAVWSHPRAHG